MHEGTHGAILSRSFNPISFKEGPNNAKRPYILMSGEYPEPLKECSVVYGVFAPHSQPTAPTARWTLDTIARRVEQHGATRFLVRLIV